MDNQNKNKLSNDLKDKKPADDLFLNLHITEEELNIYAKDVALNRKQPLDPTKKKKKWKMWSSFAILLCIVAFLILLSWILHWSGVKVDVPIEGKIDEYKHESIIPLGALDTLFLPFKGFEKQAQIIIFILMIGAFVNIVVSSKALEGMSQTITKALKGKEVYAIIPLMTFFSICGTVEGMAEESLGFYMICIPIMLMIGFDVFTGFLIVFLGAGVGVLCSTVNPFLVNTASSALNSYAEDNHFAELFNISDGLVWRFITWFIFVSIAISFVMFRALHVKKNPQKSVTFSTYEGDKEFFLGTQGEEINMDWRKKLTLVVFAFAFLLMIFYLVDWDTIAGFDDKNPDTAGPFWHANQWLKESFPYITRDMDQVGSGNMMVTASFFLIYSIALGIINGLGEEGFLREFMAGAADILSVCLVIGVAAAVSIVLKETNIQFLFNSALKSSIGSIDSIAKPLVLFLIFLPIAFLIPSTSGFAFSIFPMIAGSLTASNGMGFDHVAASGSIQAFSFASGLLNLFTPTSGVVMGAIAIARMDYAQFLKGMWKIILALFVLCIIMLLIGGAIASTPGGANLA